MQQAYRTVQVARGENPYVLVVDDALKDGQVHNYEWNVSVPLDVDLADVLTPEVQFQNTEPSSARQGDIILGKSAPERSNRMGKPRFQKGEPLCLIRVLWRNTDFGFPVPRFEKIEGYNQVTIPARSVSPEFRVLIYPYKYGEPLPKTTWKKDRTALTVQIKEQTDIYHFGKTDGGRTVLSMERAGKEVLTSGAKPSRPVVMVRGERFDCNNLRTTRDENKIPTYLVNQNEAVQFVRPVAPAQLRYTLDGSEPTEFSPLYDSPIAVSKSCELKAVVIDPNWVFGPKNSETTTTRYVVVSPEKGLTEAPVNSKNGLMVCVFFKNTKLYNDKGFFEASKIMMPDLNREKPTLVTTVSNFKLPEVTPRQPMEQQSKGFYRFSGLFYAKEPGIFRFEVNSCGPVTFDIGKQSVIESVGVFHQQLARRTGEAALDKGWHHFELVICDPLFWNINSLDPMPFRVTYACNGGALQEIRNEQLRFTNESNLILVAQPGIIWQEAISTKLRMEPGFELRTFDRTGKRRDTDFLDVDGLKPLRSERTRVLESTESRNMVRSYSGYFNAPITGIYQFSTLGRIGESAGLGAKQASCQNQVIIGDEVVIQRGVYGRNPSGVIGLKKGWHPVSLRFGASETICNVVLPDGQMVQLSGDNVFRNSLVGVTMNGIRIEQSPQEIFEPAKVSLHLPEGNAEIRYTLDGTVPNGKSPVYSSSFTIEKSATLTAVAFESEQAITTPVNLEFKLVDVPQSGSLGTINFEQWDGEAGNFAVKGDFQLWLANSCKIELGPNGKALEIQTGNIKNEVAVDVNVSRGASKAGLKLHHLKMRDNALTVALWFKTNELTGKLFGKDGYNAFGKGYKTLSCSMDNGRLFARPGQLSGGKVGAGTWQFVALTASESEMSLYLNGVKLASGPGTKDITTDALDFFVDHSVTLSGLQLFDRLLQPGEVKRLYEAGKSKF